MSMLRNVSCRRQIELKPKWKFSVVCKVTEAKVIKIVLAEAFKVACFTNTRLLLKINMHIYYNDLYGKPIGQGGFSHLLGKLLF